ncbi:MAG: inorganic diphosphatase [Gemmatimonadota bacterium]|nr:inorganic diphosphatase [Gemmatimonadota bacterium]
MTSEFVDARTFIGKTIDVTIDRPLGSKHPEAGFIYPVNYGFLPNVPAPDEEDMDAYILGVFKPLETFTGRCIAVIQRSDDDDDKLIVAPAGKNYSDEQILALTEFQERFFESSVTREVI